MIDTLPRVRFHRRRKQVNEESTVLKTQRLELSPGLGADATLKVREDLRGSTKTNQLATPINAFTQRSLLDKVWSNMHEHGLRETVEVSAMWITERLLSSTVRRHSRVPLSVLAGSAKSVSLCAEEMAQTYLISIGAKIALSQIKSEFESLSAELAVRYEHQELPYPGYYAVEQGSSLLLYALVRSLRPKIMLETGVANGHSSFFILNAMRASDYGMLHSTDCSIEVGSLLADKDREKWRLHVLDLHNLKKSFREVLKDLPPLDLFLHDSDHTNAWQSFELQAALKRLAPGGIVASDDCDSCYAFLDVCRSAGLQPAFLVERSKVFGLACTPPLSAG